MCKNARKLGWLKEVSYLVWNKNPKTECKFSHLLEMLNLRNTKCSQIHSPWKVTKYRLLKATQFKENCYLWILHTLGILQSTLFECAVHLKYPNVFKPFHRYYCLYNIFKKKKKKKETAGRTIFLFCFYLFCFSSCMHPACSQDSDYYVRLATSCHPI